MAMTSARLDRRKSTYEIVATRLAAMRDEALASALQPVSWRASVHGGQTGVIDIAGAKVFVKQIALTEVERTAEEQGRTANLFDLPLFYQYGVGSAGFGAWRELQASLKASAWALSGECELFPLVYHWRVLPRAPVALSEEQTAWLRRAPDRWERSQAVRARLDAVFAASSAIVLFIEYVRDGLHSWLRDRGGGGRADAALEAAILRLHDQWQDAAAFMNDRGMLHFDLNAYNLLTDGEGLTVADFGLALCDDFDLSPAERAFFETHRLYDRCYVDWAFVDWLTRDTPQGLQLTPALSARVEGCGPVAEMFGDFLRQMREESKKSAFPARELEAALAAVGR
jgi:hypothetical protein